ncbi:MAG: HD-GYP domain-containing protein [Actinomycetota bacterium]|nr:HD-GYP domain-containing protein [Actinomycetota bacterium]
MITELEQAATERDDALEGTTRTVGAMIEARDPYTAGHQQRVGDLAARIGGALGCDDERVQGLRIGGYLHDVGKVAVPPEVLTRPGPLTADEYLLVQQHSHRGYEILGPVPFLWPVAEIARQHHERMDGSGYPDGRHGDEILFEARIVAVADTFDAITSARPYRPARTAGEAFAEIDRGVATLFDPAVVDALRDLLVADGLM